MNEHKIDPSSLTEEQRKMLRWLYEGDLLNIEDAELGYKWYLEGCMRRMEYIFGEEFFEHCKEIVK